MISSPQKHQPVSRTFDSKRSIRLPFLIGVVAVTVATSGALLRLFPRGAVVTTAVESKSRPAKLKSEAPEPDARKQQTLTEPHPPSERPDVVTQASALGQAHLQQPSEPTRQLVNALVQPDTALTKEQ